jgi:hypothetical protein
MDRWRRSDAASTWTTRGLWSVALVTLGVLAPGAAAEAQALTITPPAGVQVEDSRFAIGFAGDVSGLPDGDGFIEARIRRGVRAPCAAHESADPGDALLVVPSSVTGAFTATSSYVADDPGDYTICAWAADLPDGMAAPVSATMTVRAPVLRLAATAPTAVQPGARFDVTVRYLSEVLRNLSVVVARASRCSVNARSLRAVSSPSADLATDVDVSGIGSSTYTARLTQPGTYLLCAFLDEYIDNPILGGPAADLAARVATITVGRPAPFLRPCGDVGGRRHVRVVRAHAVSCTNARSLARRWGARRRAPTRLGSYRCAARSGNVTCTAGAAQVRFRFTRTAPR